MSSLNPSGIAEKEEYIIWCDVETTGVDAQEDYLLEIAGVVTDMAGNRLGQGFSEVVRQNVPISEVINKCDEVVKEMHNKSSLFRDLWTGGATTSFVDEQFVSWARAVVYDNGGDPDNAVFYFGGRSMTLDRNFIAANLPRVSALFSHRSIDMTTITLLLSRNNIDAPDDASWVKQADHRALADCEDCIDQYRAVVSFLEGATAENYVDIDYGSLF